MSFLLCSYASERSRPEKIQAWISELVRLRAEHGQVPERAEAIDKLLTKAQSWLAPGEMVSR